MQRLPNWVLANPFPAIHDFESLTVLDQTARIYGAMNKLIEEYNNFVDEANKFAASQQQARSEFELRITKVMNEFMCSTEQYMKQNLESTAEKLLNEATAAGAVTVTEVYDPVTESLNMVIGGEV